MCFILLSYKQHPDYRLLFGANRDEFYERPTAPAHFWDDAPHVLAGRDLKAGGTWMGVTREGRFAALSNYRDPETHDPEAPTRGVLVANYLRGDENARTYLERVASTADRYNGFNLIVGDRTELLYFSNQETGMLELEPGLYGLSNDVLDTPWPKVQRGKAGLQSLIRDDQITPEALFDLLRDKQRASDDTLPDTGVGEEWERVLSSIFIESESYGTRSSTVMLIGRDRHVTFAERSYPPPSDDETPETRHFDFEIEPEMVARYEP